MGISRNSFPNHGQLYLDELILLSSSHWDNKNTKILVSFLRQLRRVEVLKFIMYETRRGVNRTVYLSLVGAILKEDHFQRYDAPGAPNIEATWWTWCLNPQKNMITFQAQKPRPIYPEDEYMLLVKPMVDALMAEAEQAAGLYQ